MTPCTRPILNIDDVEFRAWGHNAGWPAGMNAKEHYQAKLGDIGRRLGAQKLGYNVTVVPPRKQAFPMHNHRANEEMFFIVVRRRRIAHRQGTLPDPRGRRHLLSAGRS